MKLFFAPGACSRAPHILLYESGLKFEAEAIDGKTKLTKSGQDYLKIAPKGQVPALVNDKGQLLTEGAVIMQYIADQAPEKNLIPKTGTWERYKAQEWLNYVSTEIHKGFSPIFNKDVPEATKEMYRTALGKKFDYLSEELKGRDYLMGQQFTPADAYLHTTLNWTKHVGIDLSKWPTLMGYVERVSARPAVQAAIKAETT
jgi:glutathione S-transferase